MTGAACETPGARRIRRYSTVGVSALTLAGFAMSYGALHALARTSGVVPALAWLWPLVVDGFILVASLSVLHAVLESRSARYPWCLLLLFSAVSVAGNVAHGVPTPVGRLVAAVPPVALVLAFDLLMRQVQRAMTPAPQLDVRALASTPPEQTLAEALPAKSAAAPAPRLRLAESSLALRAAELADERVRSGQRITGTWLAQELGISDGYARRLLRQVERLPRAGREVGVGAAR